MKVSCLNCNQPLQDNAVYCHNCGQSKKESTLSINQILKDAASNIFNLDSRILHTLKDIFRPSKLTTAYVEGRRKHYVNPIRLFLFFILALISIVLLIANIESGDDMSKSLVEDAYEIDLAIKYDSIAAKYCTTASTPPIDSIRVHLFSELEQEKFNYIGGNFNFGNIQLSDLKITKTDAVNLSIDEIFEKYKVEGFKKRLLLKQYIKFANDASGGIKYAIKNFTWVVLLLVIFSAFILKLLYIRRNIYLIEHFILMLYCHVLLFVFIIFSILLEKVGFEIDTFLTGTILVYLLFQFLSFYKYYKQSIFKTFVKFSMFNILYSFLAIILAIFISLISLAIY